MRNLLKKLPFPVEFAIVIAGAFGLAIVNGIQALLHHQGVGVPMELGLWQTLGLEAAAIAVLGLFLWGRGWTSARIGLDTDWRDGLWGLALGIAAFAVISMAFAAAYAVAPDAFPGAGKGGHAVAMLTPYSVVALVLLNPFFEELFAAGYVISALKEKGHPDLAINVSLALRLLIHLSQGATAVVVFVPVGLIFGIWYVRTGRFWPLVLGHAVLIAWSYAPYIKW